MKKSANSGKDLRYRMRKKGYYIDTRHNIVVMPANADNRSLRMEMRIMQEFGYRIQYRMSGFNYN